MNPRDTTVASLPVALALIGALALPSGERERVSVADLSIPNTPAAVERLLGDDETLAICSFNIQFLGNSTRRDVEALGAIVQGFDIVLVQELVSPPYPGEFPGGKPFRPDAEAAAFFDVMVALGFEYVLSEEDTGSGSRNQINGSATEWWVAFYQPDWVQPADDLPGGFLATDRADHPNYERVPFAFPFRTTDHSMDFVLISVHLQPGKGTKNTARRKEELATIGDWIKRHDSVEKDFIIIGDMNIENAEELAAATPAGMKSLNDEVVPTNTNVKVRSRKPYDHAMYNATFTTEIDEDFDFEVINLVEIMEDLWDSSESYPGDPYHHDRFRAFYSDHHPVVVHMNYPEEDDD
jgi:hypothetical protein